MGNYYPSFINLFKVTLIITMGNYYPITFFKLKVVNETKTINFIFPFIYKVLADLPVVDRVKCKD